MNQYWSQRTLAVLFGSTCLFAGALHAAPLQFGARTLNVPNPQGFEPLSGASPRYIEAAQAYLPATNRLVEAYASPADAKALAQGESTSLARYFQLQAPRKAEGLAVSESDFQDASKQMEGEFETTMKNSQSLATELTQKGNAEVKRMTTTDPKVALSGIEYLGAFRREPWGLFFSIKSGLSGGDGTHQTLVCGGALVLVNYQLLFMYSYSQYHDENDRHWVEQATSSWADAVRAANPNDPAVAAQAQSAGGIFSGVGRAALKGAIIGGLLGLIGWLWRKSRG